MEEVGPLPTSPVPTQKFPFLSAFVSALVLYFTALGIFYKPNLAFCALKFWVTCACVRATLYIRAIAMLPKRL